MSAEYRRLKAGRKLKYRDDREAFDQNLRKMSDLLLGIFWVCVITALCAAGLFVCIATHLFWFGES